MNKYKEDSRFDMLLEFEITYVFMFRALISSIGVKFLSWGSTLKEISTIGHVPLLYVC